MPGSVVGVGHDEHTLFIGGGGGVVDLRSGQLRLEPLVVGLPLGVLPVDAGLVADVDGADELVGFVGRDDAAEVDLLLGVGFDQGGLAGGGVEPHELGLVDVTLVADEVDVLVVGAKRGGVAALVDGAVVDLGELLVGADAVDLGAAGVVALGGEAKFAGVVEVITCDLVLVFVEQRLFAGRDVEAVEIVKCRVTVVETDVEGTGFAAGHARDLGADAFPGREGAGGRGFGGSPLLGHGHCLRIDGVDVVVLVALSVLHVEHVLRIVRPEVAGHGALVGGEGFGGLEGLVDALDPDVAGVVEGLHEGDELPVGRELRPGDLGVAEEGLAVDEVGEGADVGDGGGADVEGGGLGVGHGREGGDERGGEGEPRGGHVRVVLVSEWKCSCGEVDP